MPYNWTGKPIAVREREKKVYKKPVKCFPLFIGELLSSQPERILIQLECLLSGKHQNSQPAHCRFTHCHRDKRLNRLPRVVRYARFAAPNRDAFSKTLKECSLLSEA